MHAYILPRVNSGYLLLSLFQELSSGILSKENQRKDSGGCIYIMVQELRQKPSKVKICTVTRKGRIK